MKKKIKKFVKQLNDDSFYEELKEELEKYLFETTNKKHKVALLVIYPEDSVFEWEAYYQKDGYESGGGEIPLSRFLNWENPGDKERRLQELNDELYEIKNQLDEIREERGTLLDAARIIDKKMENTTVSELVTNYKFLEEDQLILEYEEIHGIKTELEKEIDNDN